MEFVLGLLTAAVFFLCFYIGTLYGKKKPPDKVDDEVIRRQKQLREDFNKLMTYDVSTALKKKKY